MDYFFNEREEERFHERERERVYGANGFSPDYYHTYNHDTASRNNDDSNDDDFDDPKSQP